MMLAYSTNAYRKWPVLEAVDRVAALGYRGIELMADRPHLWPPDVSEEQVAAVRRRLDDRGLSIANINAFMMTAVESFLRPSWIESDAAYRQLRVQHTIDSLHLAAQLGAPCITTEPGGPLERGMSRDAALDLFVAGLGEALRHAEDLGVLLLVEPEPDLLIENCDQFVELTQRVTSPMFGLNFDIGHFYCVREDLPAAVRRMQPWTRHYHVEDIPADRRHHHLIPGRGAIDFAPVIEAIRDTGYAGWITVELYPYLDDPDQAGREARAFLTPLLPA